MPSLLENGLRGLRLLELGVCRVQLELRALGVQRAETRISRVELETFLQSPARLLLGQFLHLLSAALALKRLGLLLFSDLLHVEVALVLVAVIVSILAVAAVNGLTQ